MGVLPPEAINVTGIFDAGSVHSPMGDPVERRSNVGYQLMGPVDAFPMDEKVESGGRASQESGSKRPCAGYRVFSIA